MAPTSEASELNLYNTAFLQEEVLATIALVIDEGSPIGPNFLHALSTLIEALTIHDKVLFDPRRSTLSPPEKGNRTIEGILRDSAFVQVLVKNGALALFPDSEKIDNYLVRKGRDYAFGDFLADAAWSTKSFYISPEQELARYRLMLELVQQAPELLQPEQIVPFEYSQADRDEWEAAGLLDDEDLMASIRSQLGARLGFTKHDLLYIEGLNYRAKGTLDLARNLGVHMYPIYSALPHQIGAIRNNNTKARQIFEKITHELEAEEADEKRGEPDGKDFWRIAIPPLAQMVLKNCRDSVDALAPEILDLRHRHRHFRTYLTDYERKWDEATTRKERTKIAVEFNNAWDTLLKREKTPSTRVLYRLWDILKSPPKILEALGDKLVGEGRERYIIDRVNGLHDFWNELGDTPPSDSNRALVTKLFARQVGEPTWEVAGQLAAAMNPSLTSPTP